MSQSDSGKSDMRSVGINEFTLLDVNESYAPPEQPVLSVSLIGDVVSLAIEKYDETNGSRSYKRVAQVIVDFESLWNGLLASAHSQGRKAKL